MSIAKPIIHTNGTSRDTLLTGYDGARHAVREAIAKCEAVEFNARDYYPGKPGYWTQAREEHDARLKKLRAVEKELEEIVTHLLDQG